MAAKKGRGKPNCIIGNIMLMAIIDVKEKRDVMTSDVQNDFIQTYMTK